jgi:NADPH:quinone reductase-like Zn-dependent oxidoreductase
MTMRAVRDGGRLATITQDPPPAHRGIVVSDVYVVPDGEQLMYLAELTARDQLKIAVNAVYPLERAGEALAAAVTGGAGGAIVVRVAESTSNTVRRTHEPISVRQNGRVGRPQALSV